MTRKVNKWILKHVQNEFSPPICHAKFTSASHGRSMIEMLAVLAIIGALSIGALNGIRYILDKNRRRNQILYRSINLYQVQNL